MSAVSFLVFLISLAAFVFCWQKKRKARQSAGAEYENDERFERFIEPLPAKAGRFLKRLTIKPPLFSKDCPKAPHTVTSEEPSAYF